MNFRTLRADEIECRIGTISAKGCSLLLYKDARADMNLLDESGVLWQREHELINGNLFCKVGILIDGQWVWRQDVGTESYTEKEKGQASDSFKRACVNWGIGRELYTAPFVWIPANLANVTEKNGKWTTSERFHVSKITYDNAKNITSLVIRNDKGASVYSYGAKQEGPETKPEPQKPDTITEVQIKAIQSKCKHEKVAEIKVLDAHKIKDWKDMSVTQYSNMINNWEKVVERCAI